LANRPTAKAQLKPDFHEPPRTAPNPSGAFPYQIVYVRVGDDVHVIAVAYDGRRPGYWSDRIPK